MVAPIFDDELELLGNRFERSTQLRDGGIVGAETQRWKAGSEAQQHCSEAVSKVGPSYLMDRLGPMSTKGNCSVGLDVPRQQGGAIAKNCPGQRSEALDQ